MTKLESSPPSVLSPVDIGMILETVCSKINEKYGRTLTVNRVDNAPLPSVMGNADELIDVVEQILDNACRFASSEDTVTVKAGIEHNRLWLEIADSGPGIAKEHLPHIFETFWRLDKAHNTPGFGLGLPIAKRIVERYNGAITVESELGKGTIVRITFLLSSVDFNDA